MYSAQNSLWKCPAETSGQNNIWPTSCEFCPQKHHCTHLWLMRYRSNPLGHDCCWQIITFAVHVRLQFCIILINNEKICPFECTCNFVQTKSQNVLKMGKLLDVISSSACIYMYIHVEHTIIIILFTTILHLHTCTCIIVHVNTIGHILTIVHIRCTCTKNDSTVIVYYSIHVYYVSINNNH